jgi:hypothetical protein
VTATIAIGGISTAARQLIAYYEVDNFLSCLGCVTDWQQETRGLFLWPRLPLHADGRRGFESRGPFQIRNLGPQRIRNHVTIGLNRTLYKPTINGIINV